MATNISKFPTVILKICVLLYSKLPRYPDFFQFSIDRLGTFEVRLREVLLIRVEPTGNGASQISSEIFGPRLSYRYQLVSFFNSNISARSSPP